MTPSHPQAQGLEHSSPPVADNMPHPVYRAFTTFSAQAQTNTAQFDSLKRRKLDEELVRVCSKQIV
jgi:hypothetical protein